MPENQTSSATYRAARKSNIMSYPAIPFFIFLYGTFIKITRRDYFLALKSRGVIFSKQISLREKKHASKFFSRGEKKISRRDFPVASVNPPYRGGRFLPQRYGGFSLCVPCGMVVLAIAKTHHSMRRLSKKRRRGRRRVRRMRRTRSTRKKKRRTIFGSIFQSFQSCCSAHIEERKPTRYDR